MRTAVTGPARPRRIACAAMLALGLALPGLAASGADARQADKQRTNRQVDKPAGAERNKPRAGERVAFTEAETASARPAGLPGRLRIAGDDERAFQALLDEGGATGEPWLVLSGGGENGAFAAGLLAGWSQAGTRPAFGVVTGVSTGALIAPFAFVGPAADPALKRNYTEITAADIFEFGGTGAALTDTWPLKERLEKSVTPELLGAVAAEHAKGRRLLVATTQVDTERPVLWDMGAIATLAAGPEAKRQDGKDSSAKALALFREVMLASAAVPGVFPPVMIDAVSEGGKAFQEMHNDGGAIAPFYLAPAETLAGQGGGLPTRTVYLVVNARLASEFGPVPRTVLGVLGGTMSAAIKAQTRAALALSRAYAARTGLDLRIAEIDGRFTETAPAPFDGDYMKALYAHGEALGRAGTAFAPPPDRPGAAAGTVRGAAAAAPERDAGGR